MGHGIVYEFYCPKCNEHTDIYSHPDKIGKAVFYCAKCKRKLRRVFSAPSLIVKLGKKESAHRNRQYMFGDDYGKEWE